MTEIEVRSIDLSLRENQEDNVVEGIIATNEMSHLLGKNPNAQWREIIAPGVFSEALAKAKMEGRDIDFLADHDPSKILASTSNNSFELEEEIGEGLYIKANISPTTWGKDLFVLVKDGIVKGLSFGMRVIKDEWTRTSNNVPLRTIKEIDLFEVSALRTPAYPATLLESRGFEVSEVEVPNDLEERAIGGNAMNEGQEITPLMVYNGMTLIAEKLDAIIGKFDELQTNKTVEGLAEAKNLLTETKAVIEAQTKLEAATEAANPEVAEDAVKDENGKDFQNKEVREEEVTEELEPEIEEREDEKELEETETEEKPEVEEKREETQEDNETPEPKDLEDGEKVIDGEDKKKKEKIDEYRSLILSLKTEVPEVE